MYEMAHQPAVHCGAIGHRQLSAQTFSCALQELLPPWPLAGDFNDGQTNDDEEPINSARLLGAVLFSAAAPAKRVSDDAVISRLNSVKAPTAGERADRFSEMAAAAAAEVGANSSEKRARELKCVMPRHEQRHEDNGRALTNQERDAHPPDILAKYGLDLGYLAFEETIVVVAFDVITRAGRCFIRCLLRTGE